MKQMEHNTPKNKQANNILSSIFRLTDNGIVILNNDGLITDCNNYFISLLNFNNTKNVIDKPFIQFITDDDREIVLYELNRVIHQNTKLKAFTYIVNNQGKQYPVDIIAENSTPNSKQIIVIIKNLEKQKELENNALRQIEILAKQSIIQTELRQAKNKTDLKENLCRQSILLTDAKEAWFITPKPNDYIDLVLCNKIECKTYTYKLNRGIINKIEHFLNTPQDIYSFSNNELLILPQFNKNINKQLIIGASKESFTWKLFGLNYNSDSNPDIVLDREFFRIIFTQIFSTFDNLRALEQIIQNENRYRVLFENLDNVIFIANSDLTYKYVTPSITKYQLTPEEILKNSVGFAIHENDKAKFINTVQSTLTKKGDEKKIPHIRSILKDGSIAHSFVTITNLLHIEGIEGIVIHMRNITERIIYEENFQNIFNSSSDSIFITDWQGNFLEANNVAIQRMGIPRDSLLKLNSIDILPHVSRERIKEFLLNIQKNGEASDEEIFINKDGQKVYFEISGRPIHYFNKKALLLRTIDITDRKKTDTKIMEAIVRTEEKERARFARDLHDGIGPYLSAIKMFLISLNRDTDKHEREKIITKTIDSFDEVIKNIKEISNNISPRVMKHFGIISAINSFIKKASKQNITITINSNIEGIRFDENLEIAIFRIVTELINNTYKHANATEITISINYFNNQLLLIFKHNGDGFDFDKTIKMGKGDGLFNIIHRVKSFNGNYKFNTDKNNSLTFQAIFEVTNYKHANSQ